MRIRYLVRFEKKGRLKFIGHLDLIKLMQRCVKRSGIGIDYSKGFNPRQLVSIALPLPVGMEGLSEYAVFEMKNEVKESRICGVLNAVFPEGLKAVGCRSMNETEKTPASLIRAAEFTVVMYQADNLKGETDKILESTEIKLEKPVKDKKGQKGGLELIDVRDGIYDIYVTGEKSLNMLLAQGSAKNIKPELVTRYLYDKMGVEYLPHKTSYIRRELYKYNDNGNFESLFV